MCAKKDTPVCTLQIIAILEEYIADTGIAFTKSLYRVRCMSAKKRLMNINGILDIAKQIIQNTPYIALDTDKYGWCCLLHKEDFLTCLSIDREILNTITNMAGLPTRKETLHVYNIMHWTAVATGLSEHRLCCHDDMQKTKPLPLATFLIMTPAKKMQFVALSSHEDDDPVGTFTIVSSGVALCKFKTRGEDVRAMKTSASNIVD